jgi:hypothetical protein
MKHKRTVSTREIMERYLGRKVEVVRVNEVTWRASAEVIPGIRVHGTGPNRTTALRSLMEAIV